VPGLVLDSACVRVSAEASTHIIASCTERKRAPVPADLHLGSLADGVPSVRARQWWDRLTAHHDVSRQPANDLYGGEHWTLARRSLEVFTDAGIEADLWIASAGYGLIPSSAPLRPYSATFAQGAPDSVTRGLAEARTRPAILQAWWACLGRFSGPDAQACRSVHALAAKSPHSALIVVAAPDYIRAMRQDLLAAREVLHTPDRLIVISNRDLLSDPELSVHLIPVDERCRTVLGGTMQGLNARVAHSLLEWGHDGPLTVPRLRQRYDNMVSDAEKPPKPNRERMADEDVLTFLRAELARDPRAGWTLLLRTLRGGGRACEQRRFKELHQQVRDALARGGEQGLKLDQDS
jgi:hypothetical protein